MSWYAEKLKGPRWQKKRLDILNRENFKCQSCNNDKKTLHVHHLVYSKGEPWDAPSETLECLCEWCHDFRENFNEFFEGRSLASTKLCIRTFMLLVPAFTGGLEGIEKYDFMGPKLHDVMCKEFLIKFKGAKPSIAPKLDNENRELNGKDRL